MPGQREDASVRRAMRGYLRRQEGNLLAQRLADLPSLQSFPRAPPPPAPDASSRLLVAVFQARHLAFRPLFEAMYERHGLRVRCFLSRAPDREPAGPVVESARNARGEMRSPLWRSMRSSDVGRKLEPPPWEDGGLFCLPLDRAADGAVLVVEVVCGVLVVASTAVPLPSRPGVNAPKWTPLDGAGELQIAIEYVSSEDDTSSEDDEPAAEYSSSDDSSDDDKPSSVAESSMVTEEPEVVVEPEVVEQEETQTQRRRTLPRTRRFERQRVTVARTGGTTLYIPRGGGRAPVPPPPPAATPAEQERQLEKQLWDLFLFGIADAPRRLLEDDESDAGERESTLRVSRYRSLSTASTRSRSASVVSRTASTRASDVLAYNDFIQSLEASMRPPPPPAMPSMLSTPPPTPPATTPRQGVVLFDPSTLPKPTERLERSKSTDTPLPLPSAGEDNGPRRRSLPINAVYAQLQRRLFGRRSPPESVDVDDEASGSGVSMAMTAPHAQLARKRSASVPMASLIQRASDDSNASNGLCVGARVRIGCRSAEGVVRFVGETQFASGDWIGIELKEPKGKNDGQVNGVRYFRCPSNHGVFLRANRADLKLS